MAQRRPITSHPAFAPLIALWSAALFGLGIAVLPAPVLERVLGAVGFGALTPLSSAGRLAASGAAALLGGVLGLALALALARRARRDPRPLYDEPEPPFVHPMSDGPVRRPLHVREELDESDPQDAGPADAPGDGAGEIEPPRAASPSPAAVPRMAEADEGFMILTPQPVHPPRPAPDIEGLLEQFDSALAAFRSGDDALPDPVRSFVARQTGAPVPAPPVQRPAPSPLGGLMPDHQAELRAALDKLARAHRKD